MENRLRLKTSPYKVLEALREQRIRLRSVVELSLLTEQAVLPRKRYVSNDDAAQ